VKGRRKGSKLSKFIRRKEGKITCFLSKNKKKVEKEKTPSPMKEKKSHDFFKPTGGRKERGRLLYHHFRESGGGKEREIWRDRLELSEKGRRGKPFFDMEGEDLFLPPSKSDVGKGKEGRASTSSFPFLIPRNTWGGTKRGEKPASFSSIRAQGEKGSLRHSFVTTGEEGGKINCYRRGLL